MEISTNKTNFLDKINVRKYYVYIIIIILQTWKTKFVFFFFFFMIFICRCHRYLLRYLQKGSTVFSSIHVNLRILYVLVIIGKKRINSILK